MINLSGKSDNIYFAGDNDPALHDLTIQWYKANNIGSITIGWAIPVDPATGAILPFATSSGGQQFVGTPLSDIKAFAAEAAASGLQVVLKPYFLNSSTAGNIANNDTDNLAAITAAMAAYLPQVATAAQQANVSAIIIGTENGLLQQDSYQGWWTDVISTIRHNYSGLLGYASTYFPFIDPTIGYFRDVHRIPFASALDFVGADVYLPVAVTGGKATYDQAVAAWTNNLKAYWPTAPSNAVNSLNILDDLATLSARYGKPIVLTETGYSNGSVASYTPNKNGGTVDAAEQAVLAQAEFDVLRTAGPWLAGAIWFGGGPSDFKTNYNPITGLTKGVVGLPAAKVLGDYVASVGNGVPAQQFLTAPSLSTKILGGGHDVLSAPKDVSSSAATITSTHNGGFTLAATNGSFTDQVTGVMQVAFSDKTMTLAAAGSSNEYVALLYQAALGRSPDAPGLAYWQKAVGSLPAAQATAALAPSFTHSAEFIAKYGALTDAQFVNQMYLNVLDRAADAGGLSYWVGQMAAGQSHEQMLTNFAVSAEAITNATVGFVGQHGAHDSWLVLI